MASYTLSEASAHLGDVVREARDTHQAVELTDGGETTAHVISAALFVHYRRLEDEHDLAQTQAAAAEGRPDRPRHEAPAILDLQEQLAHERHLRHKAEGTLEPGIPNDEARRMVLARIQARQSAGA